MKQATLGALMVGVIVVIVTLTTVVPGRVGTAPPAPPYSSHSGSPGGPPSSRGAENTPHPRRRCSAAAYFDRADLGDGVAPAVGPGSGPPAGGFEVDDHKGRLAQRRLRGERRDVGKT